MSAHAAILGLDSGGSLYVAAGSQLCAFSPSLPSDALGTEHAAVGGCRSWQQLLGGDSPVAPDDNAALPGDGRRKCKLLRVIQRPFCLANPYAEQ